jgi:hypothetical protein
VFLTEIYSQKIHRVIDDSVLVLILVLGGLLREEHLQMDVACDKVTEGVNIRELHCYGR